MFLAGDRRPVGEHQVVRTAADEDRVGDHREVGIDDHDLADARVGEEALEGAEAEGFVGELADEAIAVGLGRNFSADVELLNDATKRAEELFPQTLIEIDGSEGSLKLLPNYTLEIHHGRDSTRTLRREPPLHAWAERPWFNIQDSVVNIQAHWVECLRDGHEPQTSGSDNLRTLQLVEAAYASAAAGQAVQRV